MEAWDKIQAWHRAFAKEYSYPTTVIGALIGSVVAFYGMLATALPDKEFTPEILRDTIGNWTVYLFIIGLVVALFSAYFLNQVLDRMNRFMELMDTTSKKKFRENLEKLDSLSYYYLPERFSRRLQKKKDEFGIK